MKKIKQAEILHTYFVAQEKQVVISYTIDLSLSGKIVLEFPFCIDGFPPVLHEYLAAAATSVLASLSLPRVVQVDFSIPALSVFREVLEMVYDIRGVSEFGELIGYPDVQSEAQKGKTELEFNPTSKRAVLCWSGGLDSTASYLLLKRNGYEVNLLFSNVNQDQAEAESAAVKSLAKQWQIEPIEFKVDFADMKRVGKIYSQKFASPPAFNSIPFGRDLLHLCAGMYLAYKNQSKYICFGYEREVWEAFIEVKDKKVPRYDLQSVEGCLLMDKMVKQTNPGLGVFSPVSAISKLRIYESLFHFDESILRNTTSCYFGGRCGACVNCSLYQMLENMAKGKKGSLTELVDYLSVKDTVSKETFSQLIRVYFFEAIEAAKRDPALAPVIRAKFGDVLDLPLNDLMNGLQNVNKTVLTPPGFQHDFTSLS